MRTKRWLVLILLILAVAAVAGFLIYSSPYRSGGFLSIWLDSPPVYVTTPSVTLRGHVSENARIELIREKTVLTVVYSEANKFEAEIELEQGLNQIKLLARGNQPSKTGATTIDIIWEPKEPPVPIINKLPATINLPEIMIAGTAYPNARVELIISPETEGIQPLAYYPNATKNGSFAKNVQLPAAGVYKVTSTAINSNNVKSGQSPELRIVYDPNFYPTLAPAQSATTRRIIRKAEIVLTHKHMTVTLEATLPKDDPLVIALLADNTSVDRFFSNIFDLRINDDYSSEFYWVVPQIVIKDQEATVTATTPPHSTARKYLPVLSGEFTVRGHRGFPFSNSYDSLSIQTHDYTIESVGPPPTTYENNTLTWIGSGTTSFSHSEEMARVGASSREIKLQLAYKPFASPRNLLRLAQVSPDNFWVYPASAVPELLLGLYRLIPMLWVLWLLIDSHLSNTFDARLRLDFALLAKLLMTLSLVDTVSAVCFGLVHVAFGFDFVYLTAGSLAIIFLAAACELLIPLISKRAWARWLTRISNSARNAACIFHVLALGFLRLDRFVILTGGAIIIVFVLGVLFFRIAKVFKHSQLTAKHKRALKLLAVIVWLTLAVPFVDAPFVLSPAWVPLECFSKLQSMLPYALATGLLIVLKKLVSSSDQRRKRHLVLTIGLIIFSCFLVGTTPNLFIIPIPFILSIWMFRNFVIQDYAKCGDLDFVKNEVVTDRRRLISDVLAYETAQRFQADIEKLKDKVTSGDMTLNDFEHRKSEIEQYAYDKELATTHINGLHAKTTVLGIGPNAEDWTNGKWCLRWGAALIAPFLVAYLLLLLLRPTGFPGSINRALFGFTQILAFVVDWLLAAFFFGYYFRYIRGNSGLEKGLRIACAVIICLLPTWITELSNKTGLIEIFFRAGQTLLFFTFLGMGAFDYATFRNALRDQFRWRTLARFGNMPSFTAVVSVLITSIGVGLTSVLTGQFTELLTNLLNVAFQQAPGPPP